MKLSLKIISERLETDVHIISFRDIYSTLRLQRPVFITDETELLSDTLYIATADKFPSGITYRDGCGLILVGDADTDISSCPAVILIDSRTDIFQVYNYISRIFDSFDDWEKQLEYISSHYGRLSSFEKILSVSRNIFENQMIIADSAFNYLITKPESPDNSVDKPSAAQDFSTLPTDQINAIRKSSFFRLLSSERESFVISDKIFPFRIMTRNIFSGNKVLYHLGVAESARSFRESDYVLLEILAGYMDKSIRKDYAISASDNTALSGILTAAITSGNISRSLLESELSRISWSVSDRYMVIYTTSASQNLLLDSIPYYCMEIIKYFPGVFAFSCRGNIVILVNLNQYKGQEGTESSGIYDDINTEQITDFIRTHNMRAGMSNVFHSVYDIRRFFRQAEVACEMGLKKHPDVLINSFSSCVLPYLFNAASTEFLSSDLLSPAYVRLKAHDEQNNTEYLKTLREYLMQNMNAVQAASALYIHRATIIYRLKRICEIGGTDLKKPDELLHLALSFMIDDNM